MLRTFQMALVHVNSSFYLGSISVLKQYKDNVCLAKYVCPSAYKCDSNRRKCIHLCEDFNCGDNGVCQVTVDTSGIATAECRYIESLYILCYQIYNYVRKPLNKMLNALYRRNSRMYYITPFFVKKYMIFWILHLKINWYQRLIIKCIGFKSILKDLTLFFIIYFFIITKKKKKIGVTLRICFQLF